MKVLLLTEIFPPRTGGSGRWLWEIYRRFPRPEVVVAAGETPGDSDFDGLSDLSIMRQPLSFRDWGVLGRTGRRDYFQAIKTIRKIVRDQSITSIHCGRCIPEGVMALGIRLLTGIPYVCFVHGEDVAIALTSREQTLLVRQVFKRAEFVIANSQNTAKLLRRDWPLPNDKVRVLYPGVDTNQFVPAEASSSVRQELGWQGRSVILTVGRLQLRKGHDVMIRAMPGILQKIPNALYSIVGEGEETERLQDLAVQEGVVDSVQFRGEVTDEELIRCYQQCDLFILPNREVGNDIEGFGMVLLEAQSCGKPVLAGASGGTAETMKIPDTGRVIPCDTPEPIVEAATEILSDKAKQIAMGETARNWVTSRFDWVPLGQQAQELLGFSKIGKPQS